MSNNEKNQQTEQTNPQRSVGFLLGAGIFCFPYLFSWLLLRKGYSQNARAFAFIWMGLVTVSAIFSNSGETPTRTVATSTKQMAPAQVAPAQAAPVVAKAEQTQGTASEEDKKWKEAINAQFSKQTGKPIFKDEPNPERNQKTAETQAVPPSGQFDASLTKYHLVSKQNRGGQIEAFVVNDKSKDHLAVAKACVQHYLKDYKSAYCTVFSSKAAYEFAKIDENSGSMENLCYEVTYGQALSGDISNIAQDAPSLKLYGCPTGAINSGRKAAAQALAGKALASEILQELEEVYNRGMQMEPLRNDGSLQECGNAMRKNQSFAKDTRTKAKDLDLEFISVATAANTSPEFCVSCVRTASQYCADLKKAINQAKAEMKK